MVIDELIVIENEEQKFVDSADNKVIDVIKYNNTDYHFAKENEVTDGVCDNAVSEPIIDMRVSGNSVQDGTPSPEAPIEIVSVGDKTINLFKMPTSSDVSLTDVELLENGFKSLKNGRCVVEGITIPDLEAGKTYTCKVNLIEYDEDYQMSGQLIYTDGTTHTYLRSHGNTETVKTFTLTAGVEYNQLWFYGVNTKYTDIIIVEGEYTLDTFPEYEPYGYKIPVTTRGKNLLDYKKFIKEGFTFEIENGLQYENLTGTRNVTAPFTFKAKTTYVLSADITGDVYFGGLLFSNFTGYLWLDNGKKSMAINNTRNEDVTVTLYCRLINSGSDVPPTITNLQIEVGDTSTEYEPYIEPTTTNIYLNEPLRKVGV